MNKKHFIWLWAAAAFLMTAFVFFNSVRPARVSYSDSQTVAQVVEPVLDTITPLYLEEVNHLVRKAAHLVEFSMLGVAVTGLIFCTHPSRRKGSFGWGLFYVLLVGVADETLQHFCGRSSSASDVLLDLFGALLGFGMAAVAWSLIQWIWKRKNKTAL